MSAQLAWRRDGSCGVRCAEGWTVAMAWPHPKVDGPMGENARLIALSTVLPDLYASEINATVGWFWDGGFEVALGDELNGWKASTTIDSWPEALEWLQAAAIEQFPDSEFAKARGGAA